MPSSSAPAMAAAVVWGWGWGWGWMNGRMNGRGGRRRRRQRQATSCLPGHAASQCRQHACCAHKRVLKAQWWWPRAPFWVCVTAWSRRPKTFFSGGLPIMRRDGLAPRSSHDGRPTHTRGAPRSHNPHTPPAKPTTRTTTRRRRSNAQGRRPPGKHSPAHTHQQPAHHCSTHTRTNAAAGIPPLK